MSDMVTFMNRARNAADITTKLEMYEQILKDIPANMVSFFRDLQP